jgi:lysophospholipase
VQLRAVFWRPNGPVRGAIALLQGYSEYIEKYFETARDLLARGFAVATFDWRGQGGSTRALDDALLGYVGNFSEFDTDLSHFIDNVVKPLGSPILIVAHSMGGNIALRYVHDHPGVVAGLVVTAPMLAVKTAPFPRWAARSISWCGALARQGARPVIGRPGTHPSLLPFEGNTVTSDPKRYARNVGVLKAAPDLGLARPSFGWLEAAYGTMARVRSPAFAERIETPVLLFSAGQDQIVHPGADLRLTRRLKNGKFVLIGDAQHEILQERDQIRSSFWAEFDLFAEKLAPAVSQRAPPAFAK